MMKKHGGFILFFTGVIMLFLWKLILLRGGFFGGDYLAQFYPWSKIYAYSLKNLALPFWTRYFHSGFPLMAEGQVGGFYPLNIVFFFFLPFKWAYNYIVVYHFVLGGVCTYAYTRKLGACQWGGAIAALLFCFGSAYAGCFYNTVTVKTLIWVPFVLLLFERYFDDKRFIHIAVAGLVAGMQFLAGFAQVAVYSVLFYVVYFIYGLKLRGTLKVRDILVLSAGLLISALIFLPQFILSWELAGISARQNATLGFALWGSFPPLNFASLVFPYSVFHGTRSYVGVISLLFVITFFFRLKEERGLRPLFAVLCLSIFLALGKYNPLYTALLKITGFYSFRNPSKFMFFGMFALSVMAGCGFTAFFSGKIEAVRKKVLKVFIAVISLATGMFLAARAVFLLFGDRIVESGIKYVTDNIYGKSFHRYSLDSYIERVEGFYAEIIERTSLIDPFVIFSLLLCFVSLVIAVYLWKKGPKGVILKGVVVLLLLADLFMFSAYGTGFRGNIKDFSFLDPECPDMFEVVSRDEDIFRILPYGVVSGDLPNWAMPNTNAAYGIDSIAAYSPLVSKAYRSILKDTETVDDSLGLLEPSPDAIKKNRMLLRLMNVRYIVSTKELPRTEGVRGVMSEDGIYLYKLDDAFPRGYILQALKGPIRDINANIVVKEYHSGYARFMVKAPRDGYFIFSEFYYPGWKAEVDGVREQIEVFREILMAVPVSSGEHEIVFRYLPYADE